MNYRFLTILFVFILCACNKNDDDNRNRNNNLPNAVFDTGGQINLDLPQYNNLKFPGGVLVLGNFGLNGIIIYYEGGTNYRAYELSDPNHPLSDCSNLTVESAIATCSCDDGNSYQVAGLGLPVTGTTGQFGLLSYFVEFNGNNVRVYNN
ncbi:hypothetical protein [Lacinutrix salivirga]